MTRALTTTTHRSGTALASRAATMARTAWQRYWKWRAQQATVQILRSLDDRTLQDIGVNPSEIESVVYGRQCDRTRRYDDFWR